MRFLVCSIGARLMIAPTEQLQIILMQPRYEKENSVTGCRLEKGDFLKDQSYRSTGARVPLQTQKELSLKTLLPQFERPLELKKQRWLNPTSTNLPKIRERERVSLILRQQELGLCGEAMPDSIRSHRVQ